MSVEYKLQLIIELLEQNSERISKIENKINAIDITVQKTEEQTEQIHHNYIPFVGGLKNMVDKLKILSFMKSPMLTYESSN